MSWSASVDTTTADLPEAKIDTSPPVEGEPRAQFEAARAAAEQLVASGVVGTDKPIRVTLAGHANPGHEPNEGWSNDTVTVSVHQL